MQQKEDTTMLLHELHHELFDAGRQGPSAGGSAGHGVDRIREAGESHLHLADQAIEKALSGDSQAFLLSTRQEPGE
jgi:hypothetical protein